MLPCHTCIHFNVNCTNIDRSVFFIILIAKWLKQKEVMLEGLVKVNCRTCLLPGVCGKIHCGHSGIMAVICSYSTEC